MKAENEARFWAKVSVRGADECWLWTGRRKSRGLPYGQTAQGRLAHRVAYEFKRGSIPEGQCVLHSCDNPPCCNPAHFFLGTLGENNQDRASKGRSCQGDAWRSTHAAVIRTGADNHMFGRVEPTSVGVQQPGAKLSDDQVREIRALRAAHVSNVELAARFGVSDSLISLVGTRRRWKHVI